MFVDILMIFFRFFGYRFQNEWFNVLEWPPVDCIAVNCIRVEGIISLHKNVVVKRTETTYVRIRTVCRISTDSRLSARTRDSTFRSCARKCCADSGIWVCTNPLGRLYRKGRRDRCTGICRRCSRPLSSKSTTHGKQKSCRVALVDGLVSGWPGWPRNGSLTRLVVVGSCRATGMRWPRRFFTLISRNLTLVALVNSCNEYELKKLFADGLFDRSFTKIYKYRSRIKQRGQKNGITVNAVVGLKLNDWKKAKYKRQSSDDFRLWRAT